MSKNPPGSSDANTTRDGTHRSDSSPSVQLPGGPILVSHFRPTHPMFLGNEYVDGLHVGHRASVGSGNLTVEKMVHDPSNVAGALFVWARETSEKSARLRFLVFPSGAVAWLA